MTIGIDIDDTVTNSWEAVIPYVSKTFNVSIDKLKGGLPYYKSVVDIVSFDEFYNKAKIYFDEHALDIPFKKDAKEVITKLKKEGHKIIFITARNSVGFTDAYKTTKEYLDNNNIPYDKLIVDAGNKVDACLREKVDLFIDDSIHNCMCVSHNEIDTLLFDTYYNRDNSTLTRVKDWVSIYEYINNK